MDIKVNINVYFIAKLNLSRLIIINLPDSAHEKPGFFAPRS
ncbi:Uncharacterized protein dnm_003540 [Desulfonema magnum]|uniref:Uncharacterized protein n=1 Tax=Desulfonema magnum TaxID=45655 RepID=A0A975GKC1_9BACT|nr:Uncharacterized protein dnm_003540 [Desulfonema magnum]